MKIKAVCEKTGLSDRTVRFYIDEGLLSPNFTENYLGRRSYDFTDKNIAELNDIAALRKFDFSIAEIKVMLNDPQEIPSIIIAVQERISLELLTNQKKADVLSSLNVQKICTLNELATELSSKTDISSANETVSRSKLKRICATFKSSALFLLVWLPIIISIITVTVRAVFCKTPIINPSMIAFTVLAFAPSVMSVFIFKIKPLNRKSIKIPIFALCIICIPLCSMFSYNIISECEHNWSVLAVETELSCFADGKVIRKCDACGSIDTVITKKLPHTEEIDQSIPASCISDGLTEGRHCSVCHTITSTQTIIPKTDHNYVKSVVSQTCSKKGYTLLKCSYCESEYYENIMPPTENHNFIKNGKLGYKCSECQLEICEYGYADGSAYNPVKYYITGIIDSANEIERTLVICGNGDMPNYCEHLFFHPWIGSTYLSEVNCIIISEGVTSIADGAFESLNYEDPWFGNPFQNVKLFIIKNKELHINIDDPRISGIECDITYTD